MARYAVLKKVLREAEVYPMLDLRCVNNLLPRRILAFFKTRNTFDEIVQEIITRAEASVIQTIIREERYQFRNEKKRPWSIKTYRPFRGVMDNVVVTFRDALLLAEKVSFQLGMPYEASRDGDKGRNAVYDPRKLAAILLAKGNHSFRELPAMLKELGYDASFDGSGKIPAKSTLHDALKKIPTEWLEHAIALLDDMVVNNYAPFGEDLNIFGLDGSGMSCNTLKVRKTSRGKMLFRETYSFTVLVRLSTNTIRSIKPHTNKLKPFLKFIPKDSLVVADPEFDVENNYRLAEQHGIEIHIKQKNTNAHKPFRKKARKTFSAKKYRRRKAVEIPFANMTVRKYRMTYRVNREKGMLLFACHHNITAYFKTKRWADMFIIIKQG
jgi:hypothetical protein